MIPRRNFFGLAVGGVGLALGCRPRSAAPQGGEPPGGDAPAWQAELEATEHQLGGRLGVFALLADTESGSVGSLLAYRDHQRFALCSTFKWVLAAAVLAQVDRGQLALDATVPLRAADLLDYAPVTRAELAAGSMTVEELAQAAVTVSDNTAANLLLDQIGGPAGLTAYLVALGDRVTRLDRNEPMLNLVGPDDPRDTTTPHAMAHSAARTLATGTLAPASRGRLRDWLIACETGRDRLRAGFPEHLPAGNKTGTGENGTYNDVAVLWLRPTRMLVVACYITGATRPAAEVPAGFRQIGALAVAAATAP